MREYITPNWHAVLIHAPLGLLSVGIIMEVLGFLWHQSGARMAARWMILIGAVTAVPAVTSGIYAYRDVISPTVTADFNFDEKWYQLMEGTLVQRTGDDIGKEIEVSKFLAGPAGKALRDHILWNSIGTAVIFFVVVTYLASSNAWRRKLYLALLALLVFGEMVLIAGSHNGALSVYMHGAAIEPPTPLMTMKPTREEVLKSFVPPAQVHVTLAGWAVSVALVALGLSLRAVTETGEGSQSPIEPKLERNDDDADFEKDPLERPFEVGGFHTGAGEIAAREERKLESSRSALPYRTATSRFWIITLLFAVATAVTGLWIVNAWRWQTLRQIMGGENRNKWHVIVGAAIILLPLVLAIVTRVSRRSGLTISLVSLILVLAIAAQIWLGILLVFDGPKGDLKHYNVPKGKKETAMMVGQERIVESEFGI